MIGNFSIPAAPEFNASKLTSDTRKAFNPGNPANMPSRINFSDVLNDAVHNVRQGFTQAESAGVEAMVGQGTPHAAMMALTKADLTFRFATQVRNKAVEAYREIMQLQM